MTIEKTYILEEITHKGSLKKTVAQDMPRRLSQAAFDLVQARGADCLDATAKQFSPDELVAAEREACAKLCEDETMGSEQLALNLAAAIRARGQA